MQSLEDNLKDLSDSNEKLKKENQQLKERLQSLELEVYLLNNFTKILSFALVKKV
jgi:cell division protein FtsB